MFARAANYGDYLIMSYPLMARLLHMSAYGYTHFSV